MKDYQEFYNNSILFCYNIIISFHVGLFDFPRVLSKVNKGHLLRTIR